MIGLAEWILAASGVLQMREGIYMNVQINNPSEDKATSVS